MTILSEHRPAPGRHRPVTKAQLALRFDYVLLLSTLFVAALGALMVYSATRDNLALAGDDPRYYLKRQAVFVLVEAVVMGVVALLDYHWLEHASAVIYVAVILGLLSMFVIGSSPELGATRWLQLPGGIQVQPSAFATLGMIVMVATYCSRRPNGITFSDLLKILALVAVPIVLVAKQPDLGSAIVMSVVLLVMLVVAGIPGRYLLLLLALVAIAVFGVIHLHLLKPYQVQRLTGFIDQKGKLTQVTYTYGQSESAIANGGFWGTGLFHGSQTNLSYVPEQKTDFIFSTVGEQLGFVGTAVVLALLALVASRVLRAAQTARDSFGRLLAAGIFTLLAFSIFENAGMSMGIMPIAGIPLPFFSYGGSATVAFFAAVGVALSVNLEAPVTQVHDDDPAPAAITPRLDGEGEVWRIVEVESVDMELPGSNPEVVLAEKVPPWRRLRMPVGFSEGNSIAYALHGIEVPRPLTHDLMTELLERHKVEVAALRITARHNGVYFAELETMGSTGRAVVPCRPSDGMALVLRQRMEVPIVVATWVFDEPDSTEPET